MQKKVPRIVPCGVASRVQLVYSKLSPGLSTGWWPTTAEAAHFVDVAVGVGDDPVPGDQLAGDVAAVGDGDGVRERVLARVPVRLLGQVTNRHAWS